MLVEDLYIAEVVPISYKEKDDNYYDRTVITTLDDSSFKTIVRKKFGKYYDVLSNKKYEFFVSTSFKKKAKHLDEYYIDDKELIPLRLLYPNLFGTLITQDILQTIFKEINGFEEEEKFDNKISDEFLRELIVLRDSISPITPDSLKQEYADRIIELAEYYACTVIQTDEFLGNQINNRCGTIEECLERLKSLALDIEESNAKLIFQPTKVKF